MEQLKQEIANANKQKDAIHKAIENKVPFFLQFNLLEWPLVLIISLPHVVDTKFFHLFAEKITR